MTSTIILASGSDIRRKMLTKAGIEHQVQVPRVDEFTIRESLVSDGATAVDVADALAQAKARKISERNPDALVIGCDQTLALDGIILSKPTDPKDATAQLNRLSGQHHSLYSAAVFYRGGQPKWRHVERADLEMRVLSAEYLSDYVHRNWQSIQHSVGCYKIEEEGVRLFARVKGDYFTILGMPLIQILNQLTLTGKIAG